MYLERDLGLSEDFEFPYLLTNQRNLEGSSLKVLGYPNATNRNFGSSSEIKDFKINKNFIHFKTPSKELYGASGGPTITIDDDGKHVVVGVNSLWNPFSGRYRVSNNKNFFEATQSLIDIESDLNEEELNRLAKDEKFKTFNAK